MVYPVLCFTFPSIGVISLARDYTCDAASLRNIFKFREAVCIPKLMFEMSLFPDKFDSLHLYLIVLDLNTYSKNNDD